jgi:hypothetical protein
MVLLSQGITTYFSSNCTLEDSEVIARFMKAQKSDMYMTRVFKTNEGAVTTLEVSISIQLFSLTSESRFLKIISTFATDSNCGSRERCRGFNNP